MSVATHAASAIVEEYTMLYPPELDSIVVSVVGKFAGGRGFESRRRKSDGHRRNL